MNRDHYTKNKGTGGALHKVDPFFKTRILIVDDEKRIRDVCKRVLEHEGFDIDVAEDGETGLQKIEGTHFDIILLDLMMSGISGFEVLSKVKALHPDTVIIVITGYATIEHSIEAMKKGAFDFLPKPFSPDDLRMVVGKAIEFIRTLQDIATEKSRMRVLINILADGVLTTDNNKAIALANPAFLNMIRCKKSNVTGCSVDEVVHHPRLLEMIDEALSQGPDTFVELTDEITVNDGDHGEERILGARCIPFRDRLSRNLGTVTVLNDITTLKKLDQVKSDFVSMVAHEIKSPLNSILMQIANLIDGLAGDLNEKQKQILSRVSERIKSLVTMSVELLDLAKIESGLINQEKQELDVRELVEKQVEFHKEKAASKSIRLRFENSAEPVLMMGNVTNIEEVVANLISNAIRYTPEGGEVRVSVGREDGNCVITVSDTGYGIPEEDIEKIFQRFYRVKNEKTRFINGTGLGLAIVKSIVEAHHGRIEVKSRLDHGTSFKVVFPGLVKDA